MNPSARLVAVEQSPGGRRTRRCRSCTGHGVAVQGLLSWRLWVPTASSRPLQSELELRSLRPLVVLMPTEIEFLRLAFQTQGS